MALQVQQILVGGFDDNFSYIIYSDGTHEACIVDPSGNFDLVLKKVTELQMDVVGILITHTHHDHIDALASAVEQCKAPVFVHEAGVARVRFGTVQPVSHGTEIELDNQIITVLHTPGHSEDSVCFSFSSIGQQPVLISGDTLFIDGCGRTNDRMIADLYESIQLIKRLPAETLVLPGHNYGSVVADTLSNQLHSNRFLLPESFAAFCVERLGYTIEK